MVRIHYSPGMSSLKSSMVTVGPGRRPFSCMFCGGTMFYNFPYETLFDERRMRIGATASELIGTGPATPPIDVLGCAQCGYMHTFLPSSVEFWTPGDGYAPPSPQA